MTQDTRQSKHMFYNLIEDTRHKTQDKTQSQYKIQGQGKENISQILEVCL